ncbi:MAG: DinB family protein [Bacteroidia bacterium]|nr:DinB family protein [Bacteroidia bacterium]
MNKEIQSIINDLQVVLNGKPWFDRSVYAILDEIDTTLVYKKPNENSHSLMELLYHMLTWAEFTLKSVEKAGKEHMNAIEKMDWRLIEPAVHNWEKGLAEFKSVNEKIIDRLQTIDDSLLEETVDFRKYNFGVLLYGHIQHIIYHLGQIAYVKKLLS